MSGSSKKSNYRVAQVLHWVALVVIIFNLLSGWRIGDFELDIKLPLIMLHSSVGTVIFLLMLFRWWWRRAHNLYTPPRWWKRPSMLMQWVLYPITILQALIGVALASVIDYEVLGFGFIPYSSIATDSEQLHNLFRLWHQTVAWTLIVIITVHGLERWRLIFTDNDSEVAPVSASQESAKT